METERIQEEFDSHIKAKGEEAAKMAELFPFHFDGDGIDEAIDILRESVKKLQEARSLIEETISKAGGVQSDFFAPYSAIDESIAKQNKYLKLLDKGPDKLTDLSYSEIWIVDEELYHFAKENPQAGILLGQLPLDQSVERKEGLYLIVGLSDVALDLLFNDYHAQNEKVAV